MFLFCTESIDESSLRSEQNALPRNEATNEYEAACRTDFTMTKFISLALFGLCCWMISCSDDNSTPSFGHSYSITNGPTISNDTLIVTVGYSGCEGGHLFSLKSQCISGERIDLWYYKVTPNQPCDAYFQDILRLVLGEDIIAYEQIYFRMPTGEVVLL